MLSGWLICTISLLLALCDLAGTYYIKKKKIITTPQIAKINTRQMQEPFKTLKLVPANNTNLKVLNLHGSS